jgi:hypothetical protein
MKLKTLHTALAIAIAAGSVNSLASESPVSAGGAPAAMVAVVDPAEFAQMQADMAALRAEVAALKALLSTAGPGHNDASPATASVSAAAVAAPNPAAAAPTDKSAVAIPPSTTLSGKMFVDFSYLDQSRSALGKTDASGTGLDVKRFYFGVGHVFDSVWSANLTTDFNYVSSIKQTSLFVKKAYVQAKLNADTTLRVGSSDLPWVAYVEGLNGHRYIEPIMIDRLKFGTSTDWGLHLAGAMPSLAKASYGVSVFNGGGFRNPSRSQSMDVEARLSLVPVAGLSVAVGGLAGHAGQNLESVDVQHTATRGDAVISYKRADFDLGGEYFVAKNWNNVVTPFSDKADGYSFWANVALAERIGAFARYDSAELSKRRDPAADDRFFNLGIEYRLNPNLKVAAVWKNIQRDVTVLAPLSVQRTKTDEVGVWGEMTF